MIDGVTMAQLDCAIIKSTNKALFSRAIQDPTGCHSGDATGEEFVVLRQDLMYASNGSKQH